MQKLGELKVASNVQKLEFSKSCIFVNMGGFTDQN